MHFVQAIQISALASVVDDDYDDQYFFRRVFRWYSKEYSTPLSTVYELPLEFVLQNYFESYYEGLDEARTEIEINRLKETVQEKWQRMMKEEADQATTEDWAAQVGKEEQAKAKAAAEKIAQKDRKTLVSQEVSQPFRFQRDPESTLPTGDSGPPNISMKFISDEEMEEISKGFGNMLPPDNPKK